MQGLTVLGVRHHPRRERGLIMVAGSAAGGVGGCLRSLSVLNLLRGAGSPGSQ